MLNRKRRRPFPKRNPRPESDQVNLQITSMADIFTILLVFLLKGVSSDALSISPSQGTRLASGINTQILDQAALQVELGSQGILVEKEFIANYSDFKEPLKKRLARERERKTLISKSNDSVQNDGRAIVLTDQSIPYGTLKQVLLSLSENGYSEVKFGVVKE